MTITNPQTTPDPTANTTLPVERPAPTDAEIWRRQLQNTDGFHAENPPHALWCGYGSTDHFCVCGAEMEKQQ